MNSGPRLAQFAGIVVLLLGCLAASGQTHHKPHKAKTPPLPPLPSGPTGPIQQIPLDSMPPVAPRVAYDKGQLSIVATNSTLGDILRAVRKQTGAEIEVPDAKERVVTNLGPGPAQEIIAELLNGSRFNYVLLGSPEDPTTLTRIVLVAKSGPDRPVAAPGQPGLAITQAGAPQPQPDMADAAENDSSPADEAVDENTDQAATEPEQAPPQPDQPGVKTPQELLQEMQQRQLQLQQQQQAGQPPAPPPGAAIPQRPQQENQ